MADYRGAVFNVADYVNAPGTLTNGVQEAVDAAVAWRNATSTGATVYLPPGSYYHTAPIRVRAGGIQFRGAGMTQTNLNPFLFPGASFYIGPVLNMPLGPNTTTSTGFPFASMAFTGATNPWCVSFRDHPAGNINGRTALCIEFYFEPTNVIATPGTFRAIVSSGAERLRGETFARSLFIIQNGDKIQCFLQTSAGSASITSTASVVVGTRKHVAMTWDGANLRLFVEGQIQGTQALAGTYVQKAYEDFVVGHTPRWWPRAGMQFAPVEGYIQCVRLSNIARYTANFTAPTAHYSSDGNTLVGFAPANNFPSPTGQLDPFTLAESAFGLGYCLFRPRAVLDNPLYGGINGASITDITFGASTTGANLGPQIRTNVSGYYANIQILGAATGMDIDENCYQSTIRQYYARLDKSPNGDNDRFGLSTSGEASSIMYIEKVHVTGSAYPFVWDNGGGGLIDDMFLEMAESTIWGFTLNGTLDGIDNYAISQLVINDENGAVSHEYALVLSGGLNTSFYGGQIDTRFSGGPLGLLYYNTAGAVTVCNMSWMTVPGTPYNLITLSPQTMAVIPSVARPFIILENLVNLNTAPISSAAQSFFIQEIPGPMSDKVATLKNWGDGTKQIRDNLNNITTGTTRIVTWQDGDLTVAGINLAQTWTALQTFGSTLLSAVAALLTRPRITTSIDDANGNEIFITPATASAVNEITARNAATGVGPSLEVSGADTNIDLNVIPKGTGAMNVGLGGASPVSGKIRGPVASGSNVAGVNIEWAPGRGTGNATPGLSLIRSPQIGASGSTPHALSTVDTAVVTNHATQVVDGTLLTNTTTETAIFGAIGGGSYTIQAGTARVNEIYQLFLNGPILTDAAAGNLTLRIKVGSVTIASSGAITLQNSAAGRFTIICHLQVRAIGPTGTIAANTLCFDYCAANGGQVYRIFAAGAQTVDTTADQAISITAQFGTASANNQLRVDSLCIPTNRHS